MSLTLVCTCGAEDSIVGNDKISAYALVGGWDMSPDGSKLMPEWWGESVIHWDTQQPKFERLPYCCRECSKDYSGADLIALIKQEESE